MKKMRVLLLQKQLFSAKHIWKLYGILDLSERGCCEIAIINSKTGLGVLLYTQFFQKSKLAIL
jgi:hypothetical protein